MFTKVSNIKFYENLFNGSEFDTFGQTEKHSGPFRDYANALSNAKVHCDAKIKQKEKGKAIAVQALRIPGG